MTPAEHIEILLQGEDAWNRSRQDHAGGAPDLSGCQFAHANLDGFDLHEVGLQKAYLRGATLRGACLRQADLQSAYLIDADLERAELCGARLVAVNLNGANLKGCSFAGADMREADCGGADLSGADFSDADLRGVNLLGANLAGARFGRARGLSSRQIMAGRNWEKAQLPAELANQLALPCDCPAKQAPSAAEPAGPGVSAEPLHASRTAPASRQKRKAMAAAGDRAAPRGSSTGASLRSLAGALDAGLD